MREKDVCEYCGKKYIATSYTQTYCSPYCLKRDKMLQNFLKTHDRCAICKKYGRLNKKTIAHDKEEYIMVCDNCHKYLSSYNAKLKKMGYKLSKAEAEVVSPEANPMEDYFKKRYKACFKLANEILGEGAHISATDITGVAVSLFNGGFMK